MGALATLDDGKFIELIRRTVAKDCDQPEFDMFIHICRSVRLDPLRRQIYAFVFSKDDHKKRQMSIVTSIAGYRAIADRTKCYRPGKTEIVIDPELVSADTNPKGISHAIATVYKFAQGEWFEVTETAYWDEFAPIVTTGEDGFEWVDTGEKYPPGHEKAGKPKMRKKPLGEMRAMLDPSKAQWRKMSRVMIEKCAEAKALRRAWPDDFAGLEVEEEIDRRHSIDLTATELADEAAQQKRFELIGGSRAVTIDWCDGEPLRREPAGQFGDKVMKFLKENSEEPMTVLAFVDRNKDALKEYWALDKAGALAVRKALEPFEVHRPKQQAAE